MASKTGECYMVLTLAFILAVSDKLNIIGKHEDALKLPGSFHLYNKQFPSFPRYDSFALSDC